MPELRKPCNSHGKLSGINIQANIRAAHTGISHINNNSSNKDCKNVLFLCSKAFLWFSDLSQCASSRSPTFHFQRPTVHIVL